MSDFWLSLSGNGPLQTQIYVAVRSSIVSGRLKAGGRLPSSRGLADVLGVSRTSTQTAYEQLRAEGFVETRKGSGTYVAQGAIEALPERSKRSRSSPNGATVSTSQYAQSLIEHIPRLEGGAKIEITIPSSSARN